MNIDKFNEAVIQSLGSKYKKKSDIKYKGSGGSSFSCNRCIFSAKSTLQLLKHKKKNHTQISSISTSIKTKANEPTGPKHSTRENSQLEIMYEDLSIVNITEECNMLDKNIENDPNSDPLMIEVENIQNSFTLEENVETPDINNHFASTFKNPIISHKCELGPEKRWEDYKTFFPYKRIIC